MTCAEFQKVLPFIIESGGNAEENSHLRECPKCADLVSDLRYIAEQAKLLLPMRDPSPRVWTSIRQSLEKEGLVQRGRFRQLVAVKGQAAERGWGAPMGWAAAVAAALVFAIGLVVYQANRPAEVATVVGQDEGAIAQTQPTAQAPQGMDQQDVQLLAQVEQVEPQLRPVYERNLRNVNAYIQDAQQMVEKDPDSVDARQHLVQAYSQKNMLYDMAMQRAMP